MWAISMNDDRNGEAAMPSALGAGDAGRRLNRRFLVAIVIVVLVVAANELLVQPALREVTRDAPVLNVAGRQRMLSQRLVKSALALEVAGEMRDADRLSELRSTLADWTTAHEGLQRGNPELSLPGENSETVRAKFAELQPHYDAMRQAAEALSDGRLSRGEAIGVLLAHEHRYLPLMDEVVNLHEAEARAHVRSLQRTGWGLSALLVATLIGVGRFILLPAGRMIERQFVELQKASEQLEGRVQQRTAELEQANLALQSEHRERLAAEEAKQSLQEAYSHAARVNIIGEMAAGLAHELNQPLGAVANYVEGCLVRLDQSPDNVNGFRNSLEQALKSAVRAGEIVRRVRLFATRQVGQQTKLNIGQLLGDVLSFVESTAARRGISLKSEVASDLLSGSRCVPGDAVQLQQAIINLLSNAFDAVDAAEQSEKQVSLSAHFVPPDVIEIVVTDDGDGIAPEDRDRIFAAFYSSRASGMGMGLAITRSIVEAHRGEIIVESTAGSGSRFRVKLPAIDDDQPASADGSHCR